MKALAAAFALWSALAHGQGVAPVLIGGSVAQSGMLADLARGYIKALELWQEDVNARGGLAGRRVELRLFDDGSGAQRAAELTALLIAEDKVDLLVGPFGSAASVAAAAVADRERRVMLNATGASAGIHNKSQRYVFQLLPPANDLALPVLTLAGSLGTRSITVFPGRGAGPALGRLREAARVTGISLTELGALPAPMYKPRNYPPLIAQIDATSVLLVFDEAPRLADLLREMKFVGFRPRAFVAPNMLQPEYVKRVGIDAEYSIGLSLYEPRARTSGNAEFVRSFQARHKQLPEVHAACGWAAGQLLEAAVARAGSIETEALREALATLETETVLGAYKVEVNGAQRSAMALLVQILKGRHEVIWPEAYRSAEPVLSPPWWNRR